MNHLLLFEEFETGRFDLENIKKAWKDGKSIYSSVVKGNPDHNKDTPMKVVDINSKDGEIGVLIDGDIFYVDSEDIEEIEQ